MANDRLLERIVNETTGEVTIRLYTSQELIEMGVDAPEYIAELQKREAENGV